MWKSAAIRGVLASCVALSALSCSSDSDDAAVSPPPAEVESGFTFLDDAFVFENYGGADKGPQLSPALMARMFGPAQVCIGGETPCELNPVAESWMRATNGTLNEGRSEGFAVASLLFHAGVLAPEDFGGDTVADLRLFGNQALQDEFAYWAATQAVPSAVENDLRYAAKDVVPFLAAVLRPESEKHYRMAIAQRTETGFARGHALTPIGYFKGDGDVYWLRLYDNNFPDKERYLEIDPVANSWRYEVPAIDGDEPIVYEGTADNGNLLYFSAVEDRLGVLKAPFASDSTVRTISYSSISLVASRGEAQTGIKNGEVLEAGEDRVVPAFSKCPRCGTPVPIINQTLIDQGIERERVLEITTEGSVRTRQGEGEGAGMTSKNIGIEPGDGQVDWISGTGSNFVTTVSTEGDVSEDKVSFAENGSTSYTSNSGSGVTVQTTFTTGEGKFEYVSVTVDGSDDPDTSVVVKVTKGEGGETIVEVENLPEGKEVSISIARRDANDPAGPHSETVTFTSKGGTSKATLEPGADKVAVQNADNIRGGDCSNGQLDAEFETDVDCGGDCNPCADGKTCKISDDCDNGDCIAEGDALICYSTACRDGVKNGDETDVDCGGDVCTACKATPNQATTPICLVAADCDSGLCLEGRCRLEQPVVVKINRLHQGGTPIDFSLDGERTMVRLQADVLEGPHEIVLGNAYRYKVFNLTGCVVDYDEHRTGITSADDQEIRGVIEVDCPEPGSYTVTARIDYQTALDPVPEGDAVTVALSADGVSSQFTIGAQERKAVGTFSESWQAAIVGQPTSAVENPLNPGQMGSYDCYLDTSESGRWFVPEVSVVCQWAVTATCGDAIKNQDESDVDCGGLCTPCAVDRACYDASDCASGLGCAAGVCAFGGSCSDAIKNQDESDVDCGGRCGACAIGKSCALQADCGANGCVAGVCAAPGCSDGVKNQDETDVDCGGATCGRCDATKACVASTDCASQRCVSGVCAAGTCSDSRTNQDETDVDCGGAICSDRCPTGNACGVDGDCASNKCTSNLCVESCTDGIQNRDEAGVDCGGAFCGACAGGGACTLDSDCPGNDCECGASSGNCAGATGRCGAGKRVIDLPTTDGVTVSDSFTVPAGCSQIYVQAWGAAGGSGNMGGGDPFATTPGGAGGYVSGTLSVISGDVIDVWVGQGGDFGAVVDLGGTPAIGSKYGVLTRGGNGHGDTFTGGGGDGGGLTSLRVSGATATSFVVPAGAGGTMFGAVGDVADGQGGGAPDSNGEDAPGGSQQGGGGAGLIGGVSTDAFGNGPMGGTYDTYPAGFTTSDGLDGIPANTSAPDYGLCQGIGQGAVGAGSNDAFSGYDAGGDGCIILRCVAP